MPSIDDLFHRAQDRSQAELANEDATYNDTDSNDEDEEGGFSLSDILPQEVMRSLIDEVASRFMSEKDIAAHAESMIAQHYSPEFLEYLKGRTTKSLEPKKIRHINLDKEMASAQHPARIRNILQYLDEIRPAIEHYRQAIEFVRENMAREQEEFLAEKKPTEIGPFITMMDSLLAQIDMLHVITTLMTYIEKKERQ